MRKAVEHLKLTTVAVDHLGACTLERGWGAVIYFRGIGSTTETSATQRRTLPQQNVPTTFLRMRLDFHTVFPLRRAQVHEAYGPGALSFAAMAAAGVCLWVRENWFSDTLTPQGLLPIFDPARLLLARPKDQTDALAVAEEALKDGALPFVVIEITRPLNLREGRRLQLAAKAGGTTGLCIIPEGMGSNAAETRWHAAPIFDTPSEDSTLMRWEIKKNKSGTLGAWNVRWDQKTRRVHVVTPVGQRPGSARAPS